MPSIDHRRHRSLAALLLAGALLVAALTGCSPEDDRRLIEGADEMLGQSSFYNPPTPGPAAAPGTLVRTEAVASSPDGTLAWRVIYHSTDQAGADIVTSGVVIAPKSAAPAGGRVVVGWGHPTTGAAARCAPSNGLDPFDLIEGMDALLRAGYVVAYPDYPGLGVPGPSSYLIGAAEGNSLLDAVRAARSIPQAGAGAEVLLWGHSQGGQAVLFAGQSAPAYAPELTVRAAAVAAPAADLTALLGDHTDDVSGVTIGSYAFAAYESAYRDRYPGLSLDSVLTPAGAAATPGMAELCLFGQSGEIHGEAKKLLGDYLRPDWATAEPWATLLRENTPGATPLRVPLYVAQGAEDTLVLPAATEQFVGTACGAGEHVTYREYPGRNHGSIATAAAPDVVAFFAAVRSGATPASTC